MCIHYFGTPDILILEYYNVFFFNFFFFFKLCPLLISLHFGFSSTLLETIIKLLSIYLRTQGKPENKFFHLGRIWRWGRGVLEWIFLVYTRQFYVLWKFSMATGTCGLFAIIKVLVFIKIARVNNYQFFPLLCSGHQKT